MNMPRLFLKLAVVLTLGVLVTSGVLQNTAIVSAAPDGLNFKVNDTADLMDANPGDGVCAAANGKCTLRAAIMEANKHKGTDVVTLQANTTYTLTRAGADDNAKNGDLDIRESIDLRGNGATIDGNNAVTHDRVLHFVVAGKSSSALSQLADVTIRGGSTTGNGGGVLVETIAYFKQVTIESNHADGQGGGIATMLYLVLKDSTVQENDCTCASDQQPGGGGIYNHGTLGILTSTVSGNISHFDGGGIWHDGSALQILTSTIAFNKADRHGGGMYLAYGDNFVVHSTIGYNAADADADSVGFAGGIYNTPSSTVTLGNTILGQNANVESFLFKWEDCRGSIGGVGYNLIHAPTNCVVNAGNSLIGFSPDFDTFDYHGGPTKTLSLKPDVSWAIENGNPDHCKTDNQTLLPYDQRGYQRLADGNNDNQARCDVGAFEHNATPYVINCSGKPSQPSLNFPGDKAQVTLLQATLYFHASCADTYRVAVREGSKQGPKVDSVKNLTMEGYLTAKLEKGKTYFWRVLACNAQGCTKSVWQSFTIAP